MIRLKLIILKAVKLAIKLNKFVHKKFSGKTSKNILNFENILNILKIFQRRIVLYFFMAFMKPMKIGKFSK